MALTNNLSIRVADGEPVTVTVAGQIDTHTAVSLDETLATVDPDQTLAVDVSAVTFIDSSGLRVLVRAQNRHQAAGGALQLANPSEPVVRLLEITGLSSTLTVVS